MDVQCSDGKDLLLQYTTSYATKMKDHDILYDSVMKDVSGYDIANKYMGTMLVNEPELVCHLADIKISWCSALTKKFRVPWFNAVLDNPTVQQYMRRSRHEVDQSLLQFLRSHKTSQDGSNYVRDRVVLAGVKTVSMFHPMFPFQHSLLHVPFAELNDIIPPDAENLPELLRHYAGAVHCNPALWLDRTALREYLVTLGNRAHYVDTVLSFYKSLEACLLLHHNGRFDRIPMANGDDHERIDITTFSSTQRRLYFSVTTLLERFEGFGVHAEYGVASCPTDTASLNDRLTSINTEMLNRPEIGISEYAQAINDNVETLKSFGNLAKHV